MKKNISGRKSTGSELSSHFFVRRVSAIAVLAISSLVLFGWTIQEPLLVTLRTQWPAVAPLTALGFFLASLTAFFISSRRNQTLLGVSLLGLGVGFFLTALGISVIGRHLFGWEIQPDLLFFEENFGPQNSSIDAKVAPATALCFLLTGVWIIFDFLKPRLATLKLVVSILVLFISSLILVAYLYGASTLYQLPIFIKMSLLTALQFAVLHIGLFSADLPKGMQLQSPLRFWRDKNTARERPLYASLLVVFAAFLVAGVAASQNLNKLVYTIALVSETQTKVDELDQLLLSLLDAESGQRGYLLTGEDDYLDPYFSGSDILNRNIKKLRSWMATHPQYQSHFDEIEKNSEIKFKELADTIILYRTKGYEAAKKVVQTDLGKETMARVRSSIAFIKNDQVQLLHQQRSENQHQVRKTVTAITIGSLLAAILLVTCLNLYVKNSLKRSEVEEQVRLLNQHLEHKVHEVEIVNRELESFSYSVSHDLRAPLRAMSGFGNILMEDHLKDLNGEGQKYLLRIIAAAEKMSRLINGILDLSKITRHEVKKEKVSLSYLANQQIEELRQLEPGRNVNVAVEPGLEVEGDAMLLSVFIQNLIGNAWKFTTKKETAKIDFGSFMQDGRKVFFIRDNGAGFDMAYSEKLFGTFQRLHTDAEFSGTGVGLATARRIIHLHGGDVWADSKVSEGAIFYFTLN